MYNLEKNRDLSNKLQSERGALSREQGGSKTNGLLEIRAEMPTMDDSWDVEAVVQYRTYYRKEQWLIKWQGYGEDRNTWEPKEHLLEEWVQQQAEEVKQKAVEHHQRTGRWV